MKALTLLIPVCAVLFSCHGRSGTVTLTKNNMYSIDTVRMAINAGDDKKAAKKLQEALDSYKKSKDTAKSIDLIIEAILFKPSAKGYYELAGAFAATHRYDDAIAALSMAEKLGYTPLANVMFRYAYVFCNEQDSASRDEGWLHYMELALQMGYAHPQQFLDHNLFPQSMMLGGFDAVYNDALRGGPGLNNTEKSLWQSYISQFPDIQLPLTVDKQWMRSHAFGRNVNIAWQYERFIPDMRSNKFAREESDEYFFVAMLKKDAMYTAVLYSSFHADAESPDNDNGILCLVTYSTPDGRLIDKLPVAGKSELSAPFKVFHIQPNLKFTVQEFSNVYKADPATAGYDSTNISGEQSTPQDYYQIADDGKIQKTSAPLALR